MPIEGPLRELGIHDVFQLLDLSRKTGILTAKRKPSGTAAAHRSNCSSDGSRYPVVLSSTVSNRCE